MRDRKQERIHAKGFNMIDPQINMPKSAFESLYDSPEEAAQAYARLRIGAKSVNDAVIDLNSFKKVDRTFDKISILQALARRDYKTLRDISCKFYEISGLYQRICKYLAEIYRYDWRIIPYFEDGVNKNKLLKDFSKVLKYLDDSNVKKLFSDISLEVMKNGVYYGLLVDLNDKFTIQQLPVDYCRSRFKAGVQPVIELNMKFFDSYFKNPQERLRALQLFPKDIQKAYMQYKAGKLPEDIPGDGNGWYLIDPSVGIKINLCNSDVPPLVQVIPSILDLDDAQELDRKKVMQQLLKIIIQKLPLDKNGDLIFDLDEAADIHNTTVTMLKRAIGVDVLTTFADIDVADMADKNTATTKDDLERVERTVFNNAGIPQNLFNTTGTTALEKSVLNDEASIKDFILQFQPLLNRVIEKFNRANHYMFFAEILETTIYNHLEMSKLYKDQTTIGFSKLLPQIALGHSQSSIIATATFENDILKLNDIMIPPMSSNTMSSSQNPKSGNNQQQQQKQQQQTTVTTETKTVGRPAKEGDQRSEKTIANRESMGKE